MLKVLTNKIYLHLFGAQVIALIGTGLLTVALGLQAYALAGRQASAVLGTALAIKMVAYVGVAPIVGAFANRLPRRAFLVSMDLVRAGVALFLPFVTQVWQIYVLIFVLQACSAAFTPTFQATIPDVLPDEEDYTRALSLSRLAYDTESLVSPILAAALLTVISFHGLFVGTVFGFLASATLVVTVSLPRPPPTTQNDEGIWRQTTRGMRLYLSTPRLRGLLALNISAAAAGSMVIVNTVVFVRTLLERGASDVGIALGAFGFGSMVAALALPRFLERLGDRSVMIWAAFGLAATLFAFAGITASATSHQELWWLLLGFWLVLGVGYSCIETPSGRLLKRSAEAADRPAIFAAQFALSHACWLVAYPVAGAVGSGPGMVTALWVLGAGTLVGPLVALAVWPKSGEHHHRPSREQRAT